MVGVGLIATAGADDGLVLCPFRRCTGGYCPGCGATRAANHLGRGDVAASWAEHPWVLLAALQLVALGVWGVAASSRGSARPRRAAIPLVVGNTALLVVLWLLRRSADAIPVGWL